MNIYPSQKCRVKSVLFLLGASLLWSTGGILIKSVSYNSLAIAGYRSLISAILIYLYLRKPQITFSRPQIIGAFTYSGTVICFVMANKLTTSANAILLQYTAPIYVAILSVIILKERITRLDIMAIAAVICGMVLFFMGDINPGSMLGNIIALLSGIFFAGMTVAMRYQKNGSPAETTLLGNILTTIICLPFMFSIEPEFKSIFGLIMLGVFQLGFSYILYASAIKHVTALEAILISVLEPLLNPIWVFIFSGEKPCLFTVIGGIIVLTAVMIRSILLSKGASRSDLSKVI